MFLHNSHSHREEIGTEHLIRIQIAKKFGYPNIPTLDGPNQCSSPQELEKACEASYFSSIKIILEMGM